MTLRTTTTTRCGECGGGFTPVEWDLRHTGLAGSDVHARCCPICLGDQLSGNTLRAMADLIDSGETDEYVLDAMAATLRHFAQRLDETYATIDALTSASSSRIKRVFQQLQEGPKK